jgi:hypothetical protein
LYNQIYFGGESNSPYIIGQDVAYGSGLYGLYVVNKIWKIKYLQIEDKVRLESTYLGSNRALIIEHPDTSDTILEILYLSSSLGTYFDPIELEIYFIKS